MVFFFPSVQKESESLHQYPSEVHVGLVPAMVPLGGSETLTRWGLWKSWVRMGKVNVQKEGMDSVPLCCQRDKDVKDDFRNV
jgi:hypothetical protein